MPKMYGNVMITTTVSVAQTVATNCPFAVFLFIIAGRKMPRESAKTNAETIPGIYSELASGTLNALAKGIKLQPIYSTLSKLNCDPSPKNSRNIKAAEIMTAYPACFSLSFRANVNPQITQSSTIASKISMAEVKNLMSVLLS